MNPTKHTYSDGSELWILPDNTLHREDGPAVTYSDVGLVWFLNNRSYTFDHYCSILKSHHGKTDEDIMMIKMTYA